MIKEEETMTGGEAEIGRIEGEKLYNYILIKFKNCGAGEMAHQLGALTLCLTTD